MKEKSLRRKRPRYVKKFRFQVISAWLISNYKSCRVADIGGGKGLLSYLLSRNGWKSTVIDPLNQTLPTKYRELVKKKVKINPDETVPRITSIFKPEVAVDFDLLLGLHAHGCNIQIIEAAAKYKKDFMIFPCCVIDEPIQKREDVNWRESLFLYAQGLGLNPKKVPLNFMGKSIAIYTDNYLEKLDKNEQLVVLTQLGFNEKLMKSLEQESLELAEQEQFAPDVHTIIPELER